MGLLRRAGQRDRADPGDLGRHHVHHHAGDQGRHATGYVQADAVDRDHPLGDAGTGAELGDDVLLELGLTGGAQPPDRLLQPGAHVGVELGERARERLDGHGDVVLVDAVEPRGVLQDRRDPALADVVADRPDDVPARRRRRTRPAAPAFGSPGMAAAAPLRSTRRIMGPVYGGQGPRPDRISVRGQVRALV